MHSDSRKELEPESGTCAGENLMRISRSFPLSSLIISGRLSAVSRPRCLQSIDLCIHSLKRNNEPVLESNEHSQMGMLHSSRSPMVPSILGTTIPWYVGLSGHYSSPSAPVRGTTEVLAGTSATFLPQGLCMGWFNPLTCTPDFPPRISCSTDGKQFLLEKSALCTTQPDPFTCPYKVPFPPPPPHPP